MCFHLFIRAGYDRIIAAILRKWGSASDWLIYWWWLFVPAFPGGGGLYLPIHMRWKMGKLAATQIILCLIIKWIHSLGLVFRHLFALALLSWACLNVAGEFHAVIRNENGQCNKIVQILSHLIHSEILSKIYSYFRNLGERPPERVRASASRIILDFCLHFGF